MPTPRKLALTIPTSQSRRAALLRRSVLRLIPYGFLIAALPAVPLPTVDAIAADGNAAKSDMTTPESKEFKWTAALDRDLSTRWQHFEPRQSIAHQMGLAEGVVRSRASRLGLPSRPKDFLRTA